MLRTLSTLTTQRAGFLLTRPAVLRPAAIGLGGAVATAKLSTRPSHSGDDEMDSMKQLLATMAHTLQEGNNANSGSYLKPVVRKNLDALVPSFSTTASPGYNIMESMGEYDVALPLPPKLSNTQDLEIEVDETGKNFRVVSHDPDAAFVKHFTCGGNLDVGKLTGAVVNDQLLIFAPKVC